MSEWANVPLRELFDQIIAILRFEQLHEFQSQYKIYRRR
jgi:hypothetical protein